MFLYDAGSIQCEIGPHGEIELSEVDEEASGGGTFPFMNVVFRTE